MMKIMREKSTFILILFAIFSCFPAQSSTEDRFPFHAGEKITFEVKWFGILAGEVVIELLPVESLTGVKSYHFIFTARTSPFVDLFYKFRERIDSYTDINMTHSLLYKKTDQGRSKKEITVEFDWGKKEVRYSAKGKNRGPVPVMPGTFDPLSVFYAFRLNNLNNQIELAIPVSDGKECIIGKARVIRRENIMVGDLSYNTFLVEPDLKHIRGVFEKSKNAKLQIWVTADDRRIPVRIKSKVKVGSFVADLVSFNDGLASDNKID